MRAGGQRLVMGDRGGRWLAMIESMIAPHRWALTRAGGINGAGEGQPLQIRRLLPSLQQVGLIQVSSFSREEGADNVAPREIDFQMEDCGDL